MAAGTVVLALTAVFATKANKKFSGSINTVKINGTSSEVKGTDHFITSTNTGAQAVAMLYTTTVGGASSPSRVIAGKLVTVNGQSNAYYY